MITKTVTLACPSCGFSKEMAAEKIPLQAVNATCRACGHIFSIAGQVAPPVEIPTEDAFQFAAITPPPAVQTEPQGASRPDPHPPRSSFVTTVAWIFISICGFATLVSVLQNVMLNTFFPLDQMEKAATAPGDPDMPAFFRFMMGNVRLFFASFLVLSAAMLGAAVGLLKRKNWGRLLFIFILSLGIIWNIGCMALQFFIMQDFPRQVGAPPEIASDFKTMRSVMMIFSALIAIGFSTLFGWIIKRLASVEVRREFSQGSIAE
jgi:hypothetical protein